MKSNANIQSELKKFGIQNLNIEKILAAALQKGGALAELFFEEVSSTRVLYEAGRVDQIVNGIDCGVGLRIIFDKRSVYGYTTDLTDEALITLANTLAEGVEPGAGTSEGAKKWTGPSFPDGSAREWRQSKQSSAEIANYHAVKSPEDVPLGEKIELVKRAEASARKELPEARQITSVFVHSHRKVFIVNSDFLISTDSKTYVQAMVQVVGEKSGRIETSYESEGGYAGMEFFDKVSPESIGQKAAQRVTLLLSAQPAPSGTMPVVISSDAGGTMIHEAVGHGLEADLACNGLSVYQGQLGKKVASPLITVLDDGTMPGRRGSYSFDDEGTPSKKNVLIENGVLKGYLVDRLSAMKFDMMATGNGRRESFRHKPIVRMTNTYIAPGTDDPAAILASTSWGIFVKAMGGGQVNTVNGDFVFAVTEGYLIRDGKLGDPIRGATLVGNGPEVISIVDRVGNDLGFATGTCGKDGQSAPVTDAQPTLRIPALTVGGEVPLDKYWQGHS